MNKILVICGPTATGKTGLGIRLAKKFDGEIVSADSRQVYRYMNIGTGKDVEDGKWRESEIEWGMGITEGTEIKQRAQRLGYWKVKGIPVWMLDVVRPNQEFSVAQYINLAWKVISDIWKRKKLPIIVGGTGFYIKGIIDGIETLGVPPDWELRQRLGDLPAQKLFEMLAQLDPGRAASMNVSDRKNPRRLIRAIEVASEQQTVSSKKLDTEYCKLDTLFIGLTALYKILYQRIDKRIDDQIKMGAEKEVRKLLKQGYTWDLPALSAMGYGVWKSYFENKKSLAEVVQKWKFDEHAYARRQMTWFRKDKRICWFDITKHDWVKEMEKLVKKWYNTNKL